MQKHKRLRTTQGLFQGRFQARGTAGTEELIAEGEHASVALVGLNVEGGGEGKHVGFGRAVNNAPQALFLDDELGEGGDVHALEKKGRRKGMVGRCERVSGRGVSLSWAIWLVLLLAPKPILISSIAYIVAVHFPSKAP